MKARECCGLVGICSDSSVSRKLLFGLKVIQHRGQEAAGMAVSDGTRTRWHKDAGLVHEVFDEDILDELEGNVGIAHVRYSTTGMKTADEAHPIMAKTTKGDIAVCHNGELTNAEALRDHFRKKGAGLEGLSDTEFIVRILAGELESSTDPTRAISRTLGKLRGAYSLAILIGDRLFAVRDPHGIRPLCLGKMKDGHVIASETPVLDLLDAELVRDLKPGEIVEVGANVAKSYQIPTPRHTAHCMFEYVYFSRPDNCLDGQLVYDVRRRIGEILAVESQTEADAVFPVPDSGRAHAAGYADGSVIPMAEGLIKNRFVERTFILPEQRERELSVLLKLNPVKSLVEEKRVVVVDDSIIRGTTMRKIVQILKKAGAKEVHVRIGCPPVRHPCYLGIDMKTREQFVADEKDEKQIAKEIGADSLAFISLEGLVEAIGHPMDDLCCGCLIGEYPVPIEGERVRHQETLKKFY
ncbi:MAG: amidophosphoribosyltransferase [Thermoplasmata archaeon]